MVLRYAVQILSFWKTIRYAVKLMPLGMNFTSPRLIWVALEIETIAMYHIGYRVMKASNTRKVILKMSNRRFPLLRFNRFFMTHLTTGSFPRVSSKSCSP